MSHKDNLVLDDVQLLVGTGDDCFVPLEAQTTTPGIGTALQCIIVHFCLFKQLSYLDEMPFRCNYINRYMQFLNSLINRQFVIIYRSQ